MDSPWLDLSFVRFLSPSLCLSLLLFSHSPLYLSVWLLWSLILSLARLNMYQMRLFALLFKCMHECSVYADVVSDMRARYTFRIRARYTVCVLDIRYACSIYGKLAFDILRAAAKRDKLQSGELTLSLFFNAERWRVKLS